MRRSHVRVKTLPGRTRASTRVRRLPHPGGGSGDITVITGYLREHVRRLEAEDGRSIWLCGGSTLAGQLLPEIDRLLLEVSPVVLGTGLPLFAGDASVARFALTAVRSFPNGVVFLEYATPASESRATRQSRTTPHHGSR